MTQSGSRVAGLDEFWAIPEGERFHDSPDGYLTLVRAERHEVVRAEPFDAIEVPVGTLFGDDPPES